MDEDQVVFEQLTLLTVCLLCHVRVQFESSCNHLTLLTSKCGVPQR